MVLIAAAVLVIIAQANAAQATKDKATVAVRRAAALSEAEDAAQQALNALERIRIETAEQLAASRESAEQAEAAARAARTELEQFRDEAAKAASDVQRAVQVAIQKAVTDLDRILAERVDAAEAMNEHLGKTVELVDVPNADNPRAKDEAMVAQRLTQGEPATARTPGLSARRTPKMTPVLVTQAQRMYDSGDYTVADIAESFDVSPTTIYRYLRTRRAT